MPTPREAVLQVAGREVKISNPDKLFFPKSGHTKLDLVRYYMGVAEGALRGVHGRPMALKRFVNGAEGEAFFQKRAPTSRPEWIETVGPRSLSLVKSNGVRPTSPPAAGGKKSATVSSSTTTRMPRIARSPPPTLSVPPLMPGSRRR